MAQTANVPVQRRRNLALTLLLALLVLVLALLIYFYLVLTRPPSMVGQEGSRGITHLFSIYGYGPKKDQQLSRPHGVAIDKDGNIFIADTNNHRILVFDERGRYLFKFGEKGREENQMMFPLNVYIAANDKVYVTLNGLSKMHIYSKRGKFQKEVPMDRPIAITGDKNRLYISTPGQIWVTSFSGNKLEAWGNRGKGVRQFEYPNGLGLDDKGNVFVADTNNHRVQILDKTGNLVGLKGKPPRDMNDRDRLFGLATGLVLDDQDRIFVVDSFAHAIRVFDYNGTDFGELGRQGSAEGTFLYPSQIAYVGKDVFAIADQGNDRIQVVKITVPKPKAPEENKESTEGQTGTAQE